MKHSVSIFIFLVPDSKFFAHFACISLCVLCVNAFAQGDHPFTGSADFYTSYSQQNEGGVNSYNFYSTASARQEVAISGLPFESGLQLSSFRGFPSYLPNVFSFGFNSAEFRKKMRDRLTARVEKEKINGLSRLGDKNNLLKEKSQLDEIFSHPSVISDLNNLGKADSLRQILADNANSTDTLLRGNLKKLLSGYEEVESRRELYENMKERKKRCTEQFNRLDTAVTVNIPVKSELDPVVLGKEMKSRGLVNNLEKTALWMDRFEIGRFGVNWTDLTLRGVTLDGADIRICPGGVQAGVVTGWIHPLFAYGYMADSLQPKRSVIGGSVGYGSADAHHIKVTVLQFNDRTETTNDLFSIHARKNYVISTEFSADIVENKIRLNGEASGSQTEFDKNLGQQSVYIASIQVPPPDPPEKWIKNILSGDQGSLIYSTGYGLNLDLQFDRLLPGFNFNIRSKYISPFYQSFGVPYLSSDLKGLEAAAEKTFFGNRITGFATVARYSDNLESLKPYSTAWSRYVAGMRFHFPERPSFSFGYQPIIQNSIKSVFIHSVFTQSNYTIYKNRSKNNFLFNYSFFSSKSEYLREFSTHNIIGSWFYQSPYAIGFTSLFSYYNSYSNKSATDRYIIQFLPHYTFFKIWRNAIGFQFRGSGIKYPSAGAIVESSVKAGSFLTFSLRGQYDDYSGGSGYYGDTTPFNQERFFITTNLIANW